MIPRLIVVPLMDAAEAARWVTPEESAAAVAYGSGQRCRESLTWRAVVRRELGRNIQIGYNEVGAPRIANSDVYLSVAHCRDWVAVCFSDAPCAVDIESESRDFSRVVPRYMTPAEQCLSTDPLWPAVVWCAKEALYKLSGRTGLGMLDDLRVVGGDFQAGFLLGRIQNEDGEPIRLSVRREGGCILVYVL